MKRYALLYKPENALLGFSTLRCDGHECVDVIHELEKRAWDGELWLVTTRDMAEYFKNNSTAWYNANYTTPKNSYSKDDLEVVEVDITWR